MLHDVHVHTPCTCISNVLIQVSASYGLSTGSCSMTCSSVEIQVAAFTSVLIQEVSVSIYTGSNIMMFHYNSLCRIPQNIMMTASDY